MSHFGTRPEVEAEAKRQHRASPKTGERRSLRKKPGLFCRN